MAMIFMDGFDYFTTNTNLARKWTAASINSFVTGIYSNGKAVQIGSGNLQQTFGTNYTIFFTGMHFFWISNSSTSVLLNWRDAGSTQVDLRVTTLGELQFTRNGTVLGTTTNRMVSNNWYWIEAKVKIDNSTGTVEVQVNGTSWLALTGQNTRNTANSYINQVLVQNAGNNSHQVDNFHFWDDTAGDVSAFYGEHIIDTKLPNAVGSNTTWTKGGSTIHTNNYEQVNENPADDDVTYVSSNTPNQIDSYGFTNVVPTSGTIGTIAVNTIDRIDDAPTTHTFDHYVKSSAATALSSAITPTATYNNHQSFFGTDPNTSAAWTISGRNAAEFGYKEIS